MLYLITQLEVWWSNVRAVPDEASVGFALRSSRAYCSSYPRPRACVFRNMYAFNGELHFVKFADEEPSTSTSADGSPQSTFRLMEVNNDRDLARLSNDIGHADSLGSAPINARFAYLSSSKYLIGGAEDHQDVADGGGAGDACSASIPRNDLSSTRLVRYRGVTLCATGWVQDGWFNFGHTLFDGLWPSFVAWYHYEADTDGDEPAALVTALTPVNFMTPWSRMQGVGASAQLINTFGQLDPKTGFAACDPRGKRNKAFKFNNFALDAGQPGWIARKSWLWARGWFTSVSATPAQASVFDTFVIGNSMDSLLKINPEYRLPGGANAMRAFRARFYAADYGVQPSTGSNLKSGRPTWAAVKTEAGLPSCGRRMQDILTGADPVRVVFIDNKRFTQADKDIMNKIMSWLNNAENQATDGRVSHLAMDILRKHYADRAILRNTCAKKMTTRVGKISANWDQLDDVVSCSVVEARGSNDFSSLDTLQLGELMDLLDSVRQDVARAGLILSFNASYIYYGKLDYHQQLEVLATTDIAIVGPGTSLMNSFLHRDGAVVINLESWNGTVHEDSLWRGQRPWTGEAYVLNTLGGFLRNYNYVRNGHRKLLAHVPLLRLVMKGLLKILYRTDQANTLSSSSDTILGAQAKSDEQSPTASLFNFGQIGICGDMQDNITTLLARDEGVPIEGLLWKRMCLQDDPTGCERAMLVLNKGGVGKCFHGHWIEQFWWSRADAKCSGLSATTMAYRDAMSQSYNLTFIKPEHS